MPNSSVYVIVREMVIRGRIAPGSKVAEGELARSLGVSRTPVREALQRLKHERLLESVGGGAGLRDRLAVTVMSGRHVRQLYSMAGIIEGFAARGVANQSPYNRNNLAWELTDITRMLYRHPHRDADIEESYELLASFHRRISAGSENAEAAAQMRTIQPQLDRYGWLHAANLSRDMSALQRELFAIAQAIQSGNGEEIERAIRQWWEQMADRVADLIDRSRTKYAEYR